MDSICLNNDVELIRRLKLGEIKAFEVVYNKYKSKLYFFAFSYLKSHAETEEVVQNTFISLWEHRNSIEETLSFKSYLYKITVNKIYNQLKHLAVQKKYEEFILQHDTVEDDCTEKDLDRRELEQTLNSIVSKLPEQQKKVFRMSRVNGLSHEEIAVELNISIRSVENHIYRAIKSIKESLKPEYLILLVVFALL